MLCRYSAAPPPDHITRSLSHLHALTSASVSRRYRGKLKKELQPEERRRRVTNGRAVSGVGVCPKRRVDKGGRRGKARGYGRVGDKEVEKLRPDSPTNTSADEESLAG